MIFDIMPKFTVIMVWENEMHWLVYAGRLALQAVWTAITLKVDNLLTGREESATFQKIIQCPTGGFIEFLMSADEFAAGSFGITKQAYVRIHKQYFTII